MNPIPNLVFSTRSPTPASGSDFVREVVAESPGIPPEVRSEFARRADMAGSVLQRPLVHPVYMFCPVGEASPAQGAPAPSAPRWWLFCRAVSLGLYRKGSNQLLVHGLALGEEHLDALGCNPLLLADDEVCRAAGLGFLEHHPGSGTVLPELSLDGGVDATRLNLQHLTASGGQLADAALGAAYETLAAGRRAGLTTPAPGPSQAEALLLHFHPDDRLELSFHTFYSHTRPLDYRLLLLVPEDAATVRGHFHDLDLLDLRSPGPGPEEGSLGDLALRLRRHPEAFVATLEAYRVTYRSRRIVPPLRHEHAALCLLDGLEEPLTDDERRQLAELAARGQRGSLRYRMSALSRAWRHHAEEFPRQLAEIARTEYRVSLREVEDVLRMPPPATVERWGLLALLAHEGGLEEGVDWPAVRALAWRKLFAGEPLAAFVESLAPEQLAVAEPVLLDYALADLAQAAGPLPPVGDWERILRVAAHSRPIAEATLVRVEDVIARLPPESALDALERLKGLLDEVGLPGRPVPEQSLSRLEAAIALLPAASALDCLERIQRLLFEVGQPGEALRLLFARSLPLLPRAPAQAKARAALGWWLDHGESLDAEIASSLGAWGVSEEALALVNVWLAEQPPGHDDLAFRRLLRMVDALRDVSPAAGPACGELLARLALTPHAERIPDVLERLLQALPREVDSTREFVAAALAPAADAVATALERSPAAYGPPWELAAVAPLLAARNRNAATGAADRALLRLAVTGRILARLSGPPQRPARALNQEWPAFLRSLRGLEFLERQDTSAPSHQDRSAAVRDCLELLQDELAEAPPEAAQDDPRYEFFTDLAWSQWSGAQGRPEFDALCAKLRLARTWGRFKAPPEWLWQRMEEHVPPGPLRERAEALLPPRTEQRTGLLSQWFGGGQR